MEDIIKIIVFRIGIYSFGIETRTLAGILSVGKVVSTLNTKYPNGEKTIGINDCIIPVLDLHEKIQISPSMPVKNILIVYSKTRKMFAIPIDQVETIYNVPCRNLHPVPLAVQNERNNLIKSIAILDERLIPLFAPEQLF